jgi:hypothetical protein
MPTVNAGKYGYIVGTVDGSWTTARTSGNTAYNQPPTNFYPTQVRVTTGRGGTSYWVRRFFAAFDVSAYASGYTISDLTFNFRSDDAGAGSVGGIVVKSTAQGDADTDLSTSDFYSDVDFSTSYSSNFNWPDSDSDIEVDLNSTAVTQFSNSYLRIAVVEYEYDYENTTPGGIAFNNYGYMNAQVSQSGFTPYISFTAVASGYGNDIVGVSSSNIGEVINVASANIGKVIGV